MKSSSLLTLFASFFALTQADISITAYKPKGSISINEIDHKNLRLSCQTDEWWYHCHFSHKTNGKSCQIDWTTGSKVKVNQCSEGIKYKGRVRDYENYECIVEIEEVGLGDAGQWTCKMSDYYKESERKTFNVQVVPIPTTTNNK